MENYTEDLNKLVPFLPHSEAAALAFYIQRDKEERDAIGETIRGMVSTIDSMPKTYEQDGKGNDAVVHLHYFFGGSDWFITEKDMTGDGRQQAFGFAILNGDLECAELGYISIEELTQVGAELDLYWTPKTLRAIKQERGIPLGD